MLVNDVLRLEVAVDDLVGVHIIQGSADLLNHPSGRLLWQFSASFDKGVELSRCAELLHEVEVLVV